MAIPTAYTEETFIAFLDSELGAVADVLNWDETSYTEIVNDALLLVGTDDITELTSPADLHRLRSLGRLALWRAAARGASALYDATTGGIEGGTATLRRSQIVANIHRTLNVVEQEAGMYDLGLVAEITNLRYASDPYVVRETDY